MTPRVHLRTAFRAVLPQIVILAGAALLAGCGSSTVATIGDHVLTLQEYERQFLRSNGGVDSARVATDAQKRDFLELLIKYRLKVQNANEKGFAQDPEIQAELSEYRNSLAVPYLTERALIDPKIEQLYKRRREELRVAHILLRPTSDTTGRIDSAAALTLANEVLARAKAGEPFDTLAARYSQDPGTAKNGGDLQYFTAGMTAPSFDDAIYTLQPGQIYHEPVRTAFGFHLVKMLERHAAPGEIEVGHVLVRLPQENPDDSAAARAKAIAIMDSIRAGADFTLLAQRNSEDPQSGARGGDLGWVGRRRFVPEFESAAFAMNIGEVRGPVRTQFGYHIIRVTGKRDQKPFEEQRQELKEIYRRYGFDEDNRQFLAALERKHGVTPSDRVIEMLANAVDTVATTSASGWSDNISNAMRSEPLVTMSTGMISIGDAITTMGKDRDFQSRPLNRSSLRQIAEELGRKRALLLETADLEQRYPEFSDLMREYREGVLLFRAEQEAVWNRITVKDEDLQKYWEIHRAEYRWPDRVRFREIFVTSDSVANVLRDSCNTVDFAVLAERHTQRPGYKEKGGDWGFQEQKTNELAKKAFTMQNGWIEGPMRFQYGWSIIKCEDRDATREKTFEEARSEVSSRFQDYESKRLEREWVEGLRARYGVSINDDVLSRAFSSLKEGI
jgi:peptidyl-prolyl cis-trans isomerase SurA